MSEKSHLNVYVRIRPLSMHELHDDAQDRLSSSFESEVESKVFRKDNSRTLTVLQSNIVLFVDPAKVDANKPLYSTRRRKELKYAFDFVFPEDATQSQVYERTALPLINTVLDGYNATLFAYGATGCGKTHTIVGTENDPGIIYRTMKDLYATIQQRQNRNVFDVSLSYLEVYNETIRDLLDPDSTASLELREDDTHIVVSGLSHHSPASAEEILEILVKGNEHRTRAHTESNSVSSRSHAVLQVRIRQRSKTQGISAVWNDAILSIIDLAGSERASATKNRGDRLIEGANINRSLLALGNCINALSQGRKAHIPYRDSKLTRLLKHSLSGNCEVVMIANLSPALVHAEETHNTLKYANRAKNIRIKLEKNQIDVDYHISQYPAIISQLHAEIEILKKTASEFNLSQEGMHILTRIKNLQQKMKSKELEKLEIWATLQWNSWSLEYFSITHSDSERLNEQNVTLRHNQSELQVAIDRYKSLITNYMHKSQNTLSSSSYGYLEKEQRLEEFMVQFEIRDRQYHLLQVQSERLVRILGELIKSKSQRDILQICNNQDSKEEIFYDTCTDVSEFEDKSCLDDIGDDYIENIPCTPKRINPESNDDMVTIRKSKRVAEFLGEKTPILQKFNQAPSNSPVIQKLKKRRESMIPTRTGSTSSIKTQRVKRDHARPPSPRRSRRLSRLPLMNHRSSTKG